MNGVCGRNVLCAPKSSALYPNFDPPHPDRPPLTAIMQASLAKSRRQQFRKTFKIGLGVMLSGVFRRRENVEAEEVILDYSSELNSECSTLVDFAIREPDSIAIPTTDSLVSLSNLLDEENQAWTPRLFGAAPISATQRGAFGLASGSTQLSVSLLDEDDCTWVKPRKSAKIVSSADRKKRSLKKCKLHTRTPLSWQSTELLEPEERSWM